MLRHAQRCDSAAECSDRASVGTGSWKYCQSLLYRTSLLVYQTLQNLKFRYRQKSLVIPDTTYLLSDRILHAVFEKLFLEFTQKRSTLSKPTPPPRLQGARTTPPCHQPSPTIPSTTGCSLCHTPQHLMVPVLHLLSRVHTICRMSQLPPPLSPSTSLNPPFGP